jgi:hypothetical protein
MKVAEKASWGLANKDFKAAELLGMPGAGV